MSRLCSVLLAGSLLLAACSDGDPTIISTNEGGAGAPAGDPCDGVTTQACSCTDGRAGSQSCMAGSWSGCSCTGGTGTTGAPVGGSTSGAVTDGNACRAGYYTGDFSGLYYPGFADPTALFGGFLGSVLEVEVTALASAGEPGLALTLEADEKPGASLDGVTISEYEVKDGCVVGTAVDNYIQSQNPFVGVVSGTLDCDTGMFTGTLTGYYTLFDIEGLNYGFEGPITAQFFRDPDRLDEGKWDVDEESMAAMPPGGYGDWNVTWASESSAAPPLPQECVDFLAGEVDTTSSDAADGGVTAPTDAGVADGGV